MLCVTGNEAELDALAARLSRLPTGALAELRLDALAPHQQQGALALVQRYGPRLVVCCRPTRQGGTYEGDETERIALLVEAAKAGAGVIDVEGDCDDATLTRLRSALAVDGARLLLSWHDVEGWRPELTTRLRELERRDVALTKLAVAFDEPANLSSLLELSAKLDKPSVLLGMGAAGRLSRTRYRRFGSPWTYVCEQATRATAPGQLTLEDAQALALPESSDAPFLALIGGPSVAASPGPTIYNGWFRLRGLPWAYHAIETAEPPRCVALLAQLGALGVSVTMPHKLAALALADEVDPSAREAGAANTLVFDAGKTRAFNTDIVGVREPLASAVVAMNATRALVLGAGGAARAALLACRELGLQVSCAARRPEQAAALGVFAIPWDQRHAVTADVLINATALGGPRSPWPDRPITAAVVFDLALSRHPSKLLQEARDARATHIDAGEMWVAQGVAQLRLFSRAAEGDAAHALANVSADELVSLRAAPSAPSSLDMNALTLPCPGSKSITQRALLIAALSTSSQAVTLRGALACDDSHHLSALLRALGGEVTWRGDVVRVQPLGVLERPKGPLMLGNAGTAVRFGSCLSALIDGELLIDGDARMRQRPLGPLLTALETLGVAVDERGAAGCPPVALRGPARTTTTTLHLDASLSSQYASGLLLMAPRLEAPLTLKLEGAQVSRPFLEMTVMMLQRAGVDVRWRDDRTLVVRPTPYRVDDLTIEADWSAAAFLLGAGWLRGVVVAIDNLEPPTRSLQGDAVFAEQLQTLSRPGTRTFNLEGTPDLIAPLAALALFAEGKTMITGVAHARQKECDRVAVLARELSRLGATIDAREDGLAIEPLPPALRDASAEGLLLCAEDDHRMAMAFGLCALRRRGLQIDNPSCVSKSFPDFWSTWELLA